jgi:hypothetical protein
MIELQSLSPTIEELSALNRCRIYLQAYFLSDICTGDGLTLLEDAWKGKRFKVPFKTNAWPNQQKPSPKDWTLWQTFIKRAFLGRGYRLKSPLGSWLQVDKDWEWYYSPKQERLFKLDDNG